jgi:hypothetical protein
MLARDGTPRVYNRTKAAMLDVLEGWQYFPVFLRPHHVAGLVVMPFMGFEYDHDYVDSFTNMDAFIVLPSKIVFNKLAPVLTSSLGWPFAPDRKDFEQFEKVGFVSL